METGPRMLLLSFIACLDCAETDTEKLQREMAALLLSVEGDLGFTSVAWGPVAHKGGAELFSDSLAFVLEDAPPAAPALPSYTLVIRGTNPVSLSSWLFQDLNVSGLTPWRRQSPRAADGGAYVSKATDSSLALHKSLSSGGATILDWLLSAIASSPQRRVRLQVAGHSLGGLMCATFALWLSDELESRGLGGAVELSVHAFAGPTPGNAELASYAASRLGSRLTRYANPFDLAPRAWLEDDMRQVLPAIYAPLSPTAAEADALAFLCGEVASLGYAQLGPSVEVPSSVCGSPLFRDYLAQAAYQHVMPYLAWAFKGAPRLVIETVLDILRGLFAGHGFAELSPDGKELALEERMGLFEAARKGTGLA